MAPMPVQDLDRYAPRSALGRAKDAVLRVRAATARRLDRWAALHVEPRLGRAVIRALNFELCAKCNLRCRWCSLDSKKRSGLMSLDLFRSVLEEIGDASRYSVKVLNLHHSGDVLLHPRFGEFLEAIAEARAKRPDGFPSVQVLTSATHLKGDRAEALLATDAVDWLRFSVDGGNPADFERIRVGAKWDEVVGNIHAFLDELEKRGRPLRTGVISVFETGEPEIHPEFRRLVARVTNYMPRFPHNWVGKVDLGLERPPEMPQGLCKFVLSQAVILVDGRVTLCCNDLNADGAVGDLATRTLHEIFRGAERAHHIRLMREGRRRELPMCGTCDQV